MKSETPQGAANRIAYKYLDRTFGSAKLCADIEAALNAERERCAKIAETKAGERCMGHQNSGAGVCGYEIAAAIRGTQ